MIAQSREESAPTVIVVGGGHAGVEAAHAAARMGARVTLISLDAKALGRMSCNPSIGGLAKGQIVREIAALGGLMGRVADRSAIHFRILNASKGPAVQSPRTQNDRAHYEAFVQAELRALDLEILEGEVQDLLVAAGRVVGVRLASGETREAEAVILTTGTFLGGVLHMGLEATAGGRLGEGAATALAARLKDLGLRLGRMKTGTPPRFFADSIDWTVAEPQPSDPESPGFSFVPEPRMERQVSCGILQTNERAHAIIAEHLDDSPMFTGRITGRGPRYCPSIEDKIFRFADKSSHQIFLEPEGLDSPLVYPNGISTSLPRAAQEAFVRAIRGLEQVRFAAYGYAVEYTHIDPTELGPDLQLKALPGLYCAGQINGTTGYEEAAGQGLIAGVNAVRGSLGLAPFVLRRDEAYIGVLIDDLTTRGVSEPYRMFTSLAEHRMLLRHHDADLRLFARAQEIGIFSQLQREATAARKSRRDAARQILMRERRFGQSLFEELRKPSAQFAEICAFAPALSALGLDARDREELLIEARYSGYIERELREIARHLEDEQSPLPPDLDYNAVPQLRIEAREKLARIRPATFGQAGRISGISASDLQTLRIHLWRSQEGVR